ncbi:hypothetical protein HK097_006404, partial [Rhizophlyctis rosea]
ENSRNNAGKSKRPGTISPPSPNDHSSPVNIPTATSQYSGPPIQPSQRAPPSEPLGARCPDALRPLFLKLSFRKQYEILRNLSCFGGRLEWASISGTAMESWVEAPIEQMVRSLYHICKGKGFDMEVGEVLPTPGSNHNVPVYRMRVDFQNHKLKLELLPVIMRSGHRSARKYGSDRHLDVYFVKKEIHTTMKELKETTRRVKLGERVFEFLYSKKYLRSRYFATEGDGLEKISVVNWLQWHLPAELNREMSWAKFVARLDLAFSKTDASIDIWKHEAIEDVYDAQRENCMTDGCGLISRAARLEVCRKLNLRKPWPCAFQGRIGSAKGVWLEDPASVDSDELYIRSRSSQIKYALPQSHGDKSCHYTLEVNKPAQAMEGQLNSQFITILEHGGVGSQVFIDLYKETVQKLWDDVFSEDTQAVEKLLRNAGYKGKREKRRFDKIEGEEDQEGEAPREVNALERARKMLLAGFKPEENAYLAHLLVRCFRMLSIKSSENFNLKVPKSARVLMAPDPTGILEPNEVYLNLTTVDAEKIPIGCPVGDVVVGRNPAHRPSDMQRVKCVDKPQLHAYRDVIVMSVKGAHSLASMLSGGDYDGDDVLVIWDPAIVEPFRNSDFVEVDVAHYFVKDTRSLGDVLDHHLQQRGEGDAGCAASNELFNRFLNGDRQSEVGMFTRAHDEAADQWGLSDPYVLQLAALCEQLLDAAKNGSKFLGFRRKPVPCPDWLAPHKSIIGPKQDFAESIRALGQLHRASKAWVEEKYAENGAMVADVESRYGIGDKDIERLYQRWVEEMRKEPHGDRRYHEAKVRMHEIREEFRNSMAEAMGPNDRRISFAQKARIYHRVVTQIEEIDVGSRDTVDKRDLADKVIASLALHISPNANKEGTAKLLRTDSGYASQGRKEDAKIGDVWWWPWEHPRLFAILCHVKATETARVKGDAWWETVHLVLAAE